MLRIIFVTVSFAYVNMREGLSVVSLYWRSNNKREIQKHWLGEGVSKREQKPAKLLCHTCEYY
jgi:hypothetical protein